MPSVFTAGQQTRIARSRLYEMAYWALALYLSAGIINPELVPAKLGALLFVAAGLCAAICVHLSSEAARQGRVETPRNVRSAALPASERALKVELERVRRKQGPFGAILLQLSRGTALLSKKETRAIIASADELLRRYLDAESTVLRLDGDRVAAIIPGASVFEVERMLDRLQEDLRGWTRSAPGLLFSAGVVTDRLGSAHIEDIVRDLNLAVRRAAVYNRDRFVISES